MRVYIRFDAIKVVLGLQCSTAQKRVDRFLLATFYIFRKIVSFVDIIPNPLMFSVAGKFKRIFPENDNIGFFTFSVLHFSSLNSTLLVLLPNPSLSVFVLPIGQSDLFIVVQDSVLAI